MVCVSNFISRLIGLLHPDVVLVVVRTFKFYLSSATQSNKSAHQFVVQKRKSKHHPQQTIFYQENKIEKNYILYLTASALYWYIRQFLYTYFVIDYNKDINTNIMLTRSLCTILMLAAVAVESFSPQSYYSTQSVSHIYLFITSHDYLLHRS
jgi:hypothetical protein